MESELDLKPLIEWILGQIVVAGDDGISVSELLKLIDASADGAGRNDTSELAPREGLLRSSADVSIQEEGPQGNLTPVVNDEFRARVWDGLRSLPEIVVGEDRTGNSLSLQQLLGLPSKPLDLDGISDQHKADNPSPSQQLLEEHIQRVNPKSRSSVGMSRPKYEGYQPQIYVSEDYLWQNIAGHRVDHVRLPRTEWLLLCEIAAAGARGTTLPNARHHYKHTAPGLIQSLHQKSYIVKRRIKVPKTRETSLLKLKKYANQSIAADVSVDAITRDLEPLPGNEDWTGAFLDIETFAKTITVVVKAWESISYHHLRKKMGIRPGSWYDRRLLEAVEELKSLAVLKTMSSSNPAELSVAHEEAFSFLRDLAEDEISTFLRQPIKTGEQLAKPGRRSKPVTAKKSSMSHQSGELRQGAIFLGDDDEQSEDAVSEAEIVESQNEKHLNAGGSRENTGQDLDMDDKDGDTILVVSRTQTEDLDRSATPQPVAPKKRRGRPPKAFANAKTKSMPGSDENRDFQLDSRVQYSVKTSVTPDSAKKRRGRPPKAVANAKTKSLPVSDDDKDIQPDSRVKSSVEAGVTPDSAKKRRGRPAISQNIPQTISESLGNSNEDRSSGFSAGLFESSVVSNLKDGLGLILPPVAAPITPRRRGRPLGVKNKPKVIPLKEHSPSPLLGPQRSRRVRAQNPAQEEFSASISPPAHESPIAQRVAASPSPSSHRTPKGRQVSNSTSYDDYMRKDDVPGVDLDASNSLGPQERKGKKQMVLVFKSKKLKDLPWMHANDENSQSGLLPEAPESADVLNVTAQILLPASDIAQKRADADSWTSNGATNPSNVLKISLLNSAQGFGSGPVPAYKSPYQSSPSASYISPYQTRPKTENQSKDSPPYEALANTSVQRPYKSPYTPKTPSTLASQFTMSQARTIPLAAAPQSQPLIDPTRVEHFLTGQESIEHTNFTGDPSLEDKLAQEESAQEKLAQVQLAQDALAEERLYDAIRETEANLPSKVVYALACSTNGVAGALCLAEDKSTLEFIPAGAVAGTSTIVISVSEIKLPPSASDPGSKPMELLISTGEIDSTEEIVYRFRLLETKQALQAANILRAKLVTAMTVLQFGNGGILPGTSSDKPSPEKPFKCDTCERTWKNKLGKLYHQTKSKTSCNPNWVPPPPEQTPKRASKPKGLKYSSEVSQEMEVNVGEDAEELFDQRHPAELYQTYQIDEETWESPTSPAPTTPSNHGSRSFEPSPAQHLSQSPAPRALWSKSKVVKPASPSPLRDQHAKVVLQKSRQRRKNTAEYRSSGSLQRHKHIIMSLLDANDGVFPAEDGLRIALGNVWIRDFPDDGIPDQKACTYATRQLEEDGSVIKLHFSFKDFIGVMVTCMLLTKPGIGPFDAKSMAMKENIKKNYPDPYVPPKFAPSADLRAVLEGRGARTKNMKSLGAVSSRRDPSIFGEDIDLLNDQLQRSIPEEGARLGSNGLMVDGLEQYELVDRDGDDYYEIPRSRSRKKRSELMKESWRNAKAAGNTRLLSNAKLHVPRQFSNQFEAVEDNEDDTNAESDSAEPPQYRLQSIAISNTPTANSSGAWQYTPTYSQDPKTGAWNKKLVEKRWTRIPLKSNWPEPITYMQSSNGAWNIRPFGHGVTPVYSRPSKRREEQFATESEYHKSFHDGFRPVVTSTKNAPFESELPSSQAKLAPKSKRPTKIYINPVLPKDGKRKISGRNLASLTEDFDQEELTLQPIRKKRKHTKRNARPRAEALDLESYASHIDPTPPEPSEMQLSIKNGYPEVTFLTPNMHLFDSTEVDNETLHFPRSSTVFYEAGRTIGAVVAGPVIFQFQVPKILERDGGVWPGLTEWFFVEGSFSVQGWFPSAKYVLRQYLHDPVEIICGKHLNSRIRPNEPLTSQHEIFSFGVDKVAEWEQNIGKDVLKIGTLAPDFVFYNHTIYSFLPADEASKYEPRWNDSYSFTLQTLPYDELDEDPTAVAKPIPSQQRVFKRQRTGAKSQYEESRERNGLKALNRAKRYPRRRQKVVRYTMPPEYFLDQVPEELMFADEDIQDIEFQTDPSDNEEILDQDETYNYFEPLVQRVPLQDKNSPPDERRKELSKTRRQTALEADLTGLLDILSSDPNAAVEIDFAKDPLLGHGFVSADVAEKRNSPETDNRIMVAVTVIRIITGGLDREIDWVLVAKLFPEHSMTSVQNRWSILSRQHRDMLEKFTFEFQEIFLKAYECDEIPPIDYNHLLDYDWNGLISWVMERMESMDIFVQLLTRLPASRDKLVERYNIQEDADSSKPPAWQDEWFSQQRFVHERVDAATSFQYTTSLLEDQIAPKQLDDITVAKSWARASTLMPVETYSTEMANQKMGMLEADVLNAAVTELVKSKVITSKYKGRAGPDRGYEITEVFNAALRRPLKETHFKQAVTFKSYLDARFKANHDVKVDWAADDGTLLVLTNLQAYGRIKLVSHGIPADKFGIQDPGNYQSNRIPKSRLHFEIEVLPSETYIYDEDHDILEKLSLPEFCAPHGSNCALPLWYDIADQLLPALWMKILALVLGTLATRPGMPILELTKMFVPAIEQWEMRILMEWGVRIGALIEVRPGHEGWNVAEWWWLVVGRCVDGL